MRILGCIWILLLLGFVAKAQVEVVVHIDTGNLLIGDHVTMELMISHGEGQEIKRVDLPLYDSSGIELLDESTMMRVHDNLVQKNFLLTVFDSGFYQIDPFSIVYEEDGVEKAVMGPPLEFEVATIPVPADSAVLQPIKTIIEEPLTGEDIFPYLIAALVIGGLILLVLWIFFWRRKPKEEPVVQVVYRPAHELALEKLKKLKKEKSWEVLPVKKYYVEVTHTLRSYLEHRFQVEALENTTAELDRLLRKRQLLEDRDHARMIAFLREADLVKFAKAEPGVEERELFLEKSIQWIKDTADEEKQIEVQEKEETV